VAQRGATPHSWPAAVQIGASSGVPVSAEVGVPLMPEKSGMRLW
jgi:hypothetical protein